MGETKFTPGPWRFAKMHAQGFYGNQGEAFVTGENSRIATVDCVSSFKRGQGSEHKCEERDANVHLIAAAPDLYEALEPFAAMLDAIELSSQAPQSGTWYSMESSKVGERNMTIEQFKAARVALAKARGE